MRDDLAIKKAGGPAFPFVFKDGDRMFTGMSLRDWFAGQVIDMASYDLTDPEVVAIRAYLVADAMLAQREKGQEG